MPSSPSADIHHLRLALAEAREQGHVYPAALRARVVALAVALESQGRSTCWAANALGLANTTLLAWRREAPAPSPFLPVVVRDPSPHRSLSLLLPGGARVEGLALDEVVEICRRVGS